MEKLQEKANKLIEERNQISIDLMKLMVLLTYLVN